MDILQSFIFFAPYDKQLQLSQPTTTSAGNENVKSAAGLLIKQGLFTCLTLVLYISFRYCAKSTT